MEMVMWHTCPYIGVSYHIFELLPSNSLYHPGPSKRFPKICPFQPGFPLQPHFTVLDMYQIICSINHKYKHDVDETNSILQSGVLGAARSQQMTSLGGCRIQTNCIVSHYRLELASPQGYFFYKKKGAYYGLFFKLVTVCDQNLAIFVKYTSVPSLLISKSSALLNFN